MGATPPPAQFKTIMVATDFSHNADVALRIGTGIAAAHGAQLHIVHALGSTSTKELSIDAKDRLERSLAALEDTVREMDVVVSSLHFPGASWRVITDAARDLHADLVVIGARGQTNYAKLVLGSTTDRVLRASTAPVLTVHPDDPADTSSVRMIVLATDFSSQSRHAIDTALRLVSNLPGSRRIVLLHAWQPLVEYEFSVGTGLVAHELDETKSLAEAAVEELANDLRAAGHEIETVVRQGYPATVIQREAESLEANLIAIGTHGRSGLQHLMLGSIAERVVHHATCPVLTTRGTSDESNT